MRRALGLAAAASALLLAPPSTRAQDAPPGSASETNPEIAERLYREGSELMQKGELAVACGKLAESQKIEPAAGAALALALCRERQGKLATAVAAYVVAARIAREAGDEERATAAEARAAALRPRVPRLDVELPAAVRQRGSIVLRIDGEATTPLTSSPGLRLDVDPGPHLIEASSGEWASAPATFEAHEGGVTSVVLGERAAAHGAQDTTVGARPAPAPAPPTPSDGPTTTRILGLASLGLGALGVGIGTAFAIAGTSDASALDELGYDGDRGTCRARLADCQSAFQGAETAADAATALWIAGGAFVALGVTLVVAGGNESGEGRSDDRAAAALQLGPAGARLRGWY